MIEICAFDFKVYIYIGMLCLLMHIWGYPYGNKILSLLSDLAGPVADGGVDDKMPLFEGVSMGSSCTERKILNTNYHWAMWWITCLCGYQHV